mmetsp:Transcript_7172/g.12668  ORF Transcript_7172/g.12668 Transcript_7172/m.12668 type:complete len:439 (+) Transcript_7172:436-1752(+)
MSRNIHIHDIVRNLPPTLVDLLQNIQFVHGKHFGNVGQHTRLVLGNDRESYRMFGRRAEAGGGEVDGVSDRAGFEEVANGLGGHGGGGVFSFAGGGAEVGKEDGVGVVPEDVVGEVGDVPSIIAIQMSLQGFTIHQFPPGKVEQHSPTLEVSNNLLSNNSMCAPLALDVRDVNGNVIRIPHSIGNAVREFNATGKLERILNTETGIVTHHAHAELFGIPGRRGANVSETDHRQGLPLNLPPAEESLVLLHALLGQSLLAKGRHVVDSIDDATRSEEHTGQYQFLHGVGVRSRSVEDGNAQFGHARHGHVVRTGTATSDGSHCVGHLVLLQLVRPQQYSMGILGSVSLLNFVLDVGELFQSIGRDFVVGFDLEFARLVGFGIAEGFPFAASVFDGDVGEGRGGGGDLSPGGGGGYRGCGFADALSECWDHGCADLLRSV